MWYMFDKKVLFIDTSTHLAHYGTKRMKWGIRHWQNYDGTFTEAGKLRYFGDSKARAKFRAYTIRKTGYEPPKDHDNPMGVYTKNAKIEVFRKDDVTGERYRLRDNVGYSTYQDLYDLDNWGEHPDKESVEHVFKSHKITRNQLLDYEKAQYLESLSHVLLVSSKFSKEFKDVLDSEIGKLKNTEGLSDYGKRTLYSILTSSDPSDLNPPTEAFGLSYTPPLGDHNIFNVIPTLIDTIPSNDSYGEKSFFDASSRVSALLKKHYKDLEKAAEENVRRLVKEYDLNKYDFWLSEDPGYVLIGKERQYEPLADPMDWWYLTGSEKLNAPGSPYDGMSFEEAEDEYHRLLEKEAKHSDMFVKDNTLILVDKSSFISHYNTKGSKWGVRHWQNYDGTFTEAGKERYFGQKPKRGDNHAAGLSDDTLRKTVNRINAERNYTNAARSRYATSASIKARKASAVFDTVSKTANTASNIVRLVSSARKMSGNSGDDVSNKLASATATLTVLKTFSDFLKKQSDKKTNEIDNTRLIRDLDSLSDSDLAAATNRINLENAYNSYVDSALGKTGREKVMDVVDTIGGVSASFTDVFNKMNEANDKAKKSSNAKHSDNSTRVLFIDTTTHLIHYGTKHMKWGVRHWQNYDGTFTEAGKERYFGDAKERNRFRSQAIRKTGYKTNVITTDSVYKWNKESVNKIYSSRTSKKIDDLRRKANPDFVEDAMYTMFGDTDFDMIDTLMVDYEPTREQFIDCQMSYALESARGCLFAGMRYSDEIKALKVSEVNKLKNVEQYSDAGKQFVYDVLHNSVNDSDGLDSKTVMDDYKKFFLSGPKAIYDVVPELLDVLPSPGKSDGMSFDERISKLDDLIDRNYDAIRKQIENDVDSIAEDTGLNGYESWNNTREPKEPPHGLPGMHWGPRAYNYDDANKKN